MGETKGKIYIYCKVRVHAESALRDCGGCRVWALFTRNVVAAAQQRQGKRDLQPEAIDHFSGLSNRPSSPCSEPPFKVSIEGICNREYVTHQSQRQPCRCLLTGHPITKGVEMVKHRQLPDTLFVPALVALDSQRQQMLNSHIY